MAYQFEPSLPELPPMSGSVSSEGGTRIGEGPPSYRPFTDEHYIDKLTGFGYIVFSNGDEPARLY